MFDILYVKTLTAQSLMVEKSKHWDISKNSQKDFQMTSFAEKSNVNIKFNHQFWINMQIFYQSIIRMIYLFNTINQDLFTIRREKEENNKS